MADLVAVKLSFALGGSGLSVFVVQQTSSFSSEVVHRCLTKVHPMFGSAGPQTSPIKGERRKNMKVAIEAAIKAATKVNPKKSVLVKTVAGGALACAMALSAPAFADRYSDVRSYDHGRTGLGVVDRDYRRYDSRYTQNHSGPITLRLNYDANGDGRISLRRLLERQHDINPDNWRIRSVNLRHKSKRVACADLSIGGRSTGPVYLRKGITTLHAPRGRTNGRWMLDYENIKLRDVAVTLEPIRHYRQGDDRRYSDRVYNRSIDRSSSRNRSAFAYRR